MLRLREDRGWQASCNGCALYVGAAYARAFLALIACSPECSARISHPLQLFFFIPRSRRFENTKDGCSSFPAKSSEECPRLSAHLYIYSFAGRPGSSLYTSSEYVLPFAFIHVHASPNSLLCLPFISSIQRPPTARRRRAFACDHPNRRCAAAFWCLA